MNLKFFLLFLFLFTSCTYNEIVPELNTSCNQEGGVEWSPSFNDCVEPIIQNNCISCHADNSPSGSLSDYTQILDMINNKDLLNRIKTDMPPSGTMSQNNIDIIEQWINNGANNN